MIKNFLIGVVITAAFIGATGITAVGVSYAVSFLTNSSFWIFMSGGIVVALALSGLVYASLNQE